VRVLLVGAVPRSSSDILEAIRGVRADAILRLVTASAGRQHLRDDSTWDLLLIGHLSGDAAAFQLLAEARAARPAIPIVLLSSSDRKADVLRALDLGAVGFVPADSSQSTLVAALRLVLGGGIYVPPGIMRRSGSRMDTASAALDRSWDGRLHDAPALSATPDRSLASFGLTPRQTDVLFLLLQGQTNKQIARELNLSVETVKEHVAAVLRTLNVNSRAQAVLAVNPLHSAIWDWRARRDGLRPKP
jgi:DNA-binding NarL/FixJ family response regulator